MIDLIARDLTRELGGLKGFSRRNLYYMKRFHGFYTDQGEFVQQLVAQIPWGHNILILGKLKEPDKAFWYAQKTLENNWSPNVLGLQIENRLYERQAQKLKIDK